MRAVVRALSLGRLLMVVDGAAADLVMVDGLVDLETLSLVRTFLSDDDDPMDDPRPLSAYRGVVRRGRVDRLTDDCSDGMTPSINSVLYALVEGFSTLTTPRGTGSDSSRKRRRGVEDDWLPAAVSSNDSMTSAARRLCDSTAKSSRLDNERSRAERLKAPSTSFVGEEGEWKVAPLRREAIVVLTVGRLDEFARRVTAIDVVFVVLRGCVNDILSGQFL